MSILDPNLKREHNNTIDALRGIGIIMVLAIHSSFPFLGPAQHTLEIIQAISAPSVLIFFFCSGYCLAPRCSKDLCAVHFAPLLRFVVAFLFWTLLCFLSALVYCRLALICPWSNQLNSLNPFNLSGIPGSIVNFQLYFLTAIAIIRLFDLVLYQSRALGRFSFNGIHSLLAILAVSFIGLPPEWHGSSWSNFAIYLFTFGIGRIAKTVLNPILSITSVGHLQRRSRVARLIALALFLSVFLSFGLLAVPGFLGLVLLPFYLILLLLTLNIFSSCFPPALRILSVTGLMSGGIYLLHAPFLSSLLFKVYSRFIPVQNLIAPIMYALLLGLASIFILLLLRLVMPDKIFKWLLLTDNLRLVAVAK
jgi:peptidoglycan/LPS O-acetylase OafA/YrhL